MITRKLAQFAAYSHCRSECRKWLLRHLLTGSQEDKPITIQQMRENLKDVVGAQRLWGTDDKPLGSADLGVVQSQDDLAVRRMTDSYREATIPLGSDPFLKEKYINLYRGIRFGRILEDLDTFAVAIGYAHNADPEYGGKPKSPMSIVTALVDRIEFSDSIVPDEDIKMIGHVTWAGKTSLEITMDLDQEINNTWRRILEAKFVMVARNPISKGSAFVCQLQPGGPEEERLFGEGEANKEKRIEEGKKTLLKEPPNEEERQLIHEQFLQTIDPSQASFRIRVKPENTVWMENTILKNLIICFPEQRNLYNRIFGGYLMRKAFELAWANASLYSKSRPNIRVIDDIAFRKPVEVGSLLFLSSQIVYTIGSQLQVKVHAEVVNPKDGSHQTTNDFHFTFETQNPDLLRVIPKTYAESMLYLDGKRHFEH